MPEAKIDPDWARVVGAAEDAVTRDHGIGCQYYVSAHESPRIDRLDRIVETAVAAAVRYIQQRGLDVGGLQVSTEVERLAPTAEQLQQQLNEG